MEEFNDANRNQINIAILGPTSVGKSTLLNTIFVNTYSDMKQKRTTMTPQVYYESKKKDKVIDKEIKLQNRAINSNIILKTEKSEPLTEEDMKEYLYLVPRIYGLVDLMKEVYLTIYDTPGLDDSKSADIYFKYVKNNFYKFDIVIFVIDIDTALNSTDQIKILVEILTNLKINKEKYNITTSLLVLTNKCDDMQYEDGKYNFLDDELEEMFEQTKNTIDKKVKEIYPETDYQIQPISAEDSYIYRMYEKNPKYDFNIKYINKFGFNEYGKSRWNRLKEDKKKDKIKELLSKMDIKENLKQSGFYGLKKCLKNMLTKEKQYLYICNHIVYGLKLINKNNTIDISEDINQFYLYFKRFNELIQYYSKDLDKKYVNLDIFNEHINKYLEGYNKNIIEKYIKGENDKDYYPICDSNIIQIEQIHDTFKELYRMFNGHCISITFINHILISTLNNYYSNQINNMSKPISDTLVYLNKLVVNKFKITKELIGNIFSNNDMKQKNPSEILSYLTDLEKKELISLTDKINYMNSLLINIYKDLEANSTIPTRFTDIQKKGMYCYYINLIWNTFVSEHLDLCFIGNFKDSINTLVFYSNKNNKQFITQTNIEYKPTEELDSVLDLELYLISLYGEFYNIRFKSIILNKFTSELYKNDLEKKESIKVKSKKKHKKKHKITKDNINEIKSTTHQLFDEFESAESNIEVSDGEDLDSGHISGDLDTELGLSSNA